MTRSQEYLLSVVVPLYNESAALDNLNASLLKTLRDTVPDAYEVIYCDDGSTDDSTSLVREFCTKNPRIKLIKLSRNFGKEIATTAGIHQASGAAILTLDADGQHPVELIPEFVKRWQAGSKVVIGIREANAGESFVKNYGSRLFYAFFNRFMGTKLVPGATDFRLIDRSVQQEFIRLTERNRITRGLIDWLGYKREYITFAANPRLAGEPSYSFKKLFKLAIDSMVSLSVSPLYIAAYLGIVVLPVSLIIGLIMAVNALAGDPLALHATGSSYVVVLVLFLIGILLVSQGIIGLYLSHIHAETQNRPLYVVDKSNSIGATFADSET